MKSLNRVREEGGGEGRVAEGVGGGKGRVAEGVGGGKGRVAVSSAAPSAAGH